MLKREDVLSLEFLKKDAYTGSHQGMRFRLEKSETEEKKQLLATVWPEPLNFHNTPEDKKQNALFDFCEDGIVDAIAWMNDRLFDYAVR